MQRVAGLDRQVPGRAYLRAGPSLQQFQVARQIIAAGLVPIIEPEVDIKCPDKAAAESLLEAAVTVQLNSLPEGDLVMLKLTIPDRVTSLGDVAFAYCTSLSGVTIGNSVSAIGTSGCMVNHI